MNVAVDFLKVLNVYFLFLLLIDKVFNFKELKKINHFQHRISGKKFFFKSVQGISR